MQCFFVFRDLGGFWVSIYVEITVRHILEFEIICLHRGRFQEHAMCLRKSQICTRGSPERSPKIGTKHVRGHLKNVQRLCTFLRHNLRTIFGGGSSENMSTHKLCAFFWQDLKFLIRPSCTGKSTLNPRKNNQGAWRVLGSNLPILNMEVIASSSSLCRGEAFFTYSWSFLLTVELLCLQSVRVLLSSTHPHCKQTCSNCK